MGQELYNEGKTAMSSEKNIASIGMRLLTAALVLCLLCIAVPCLAAAPPAAISRDEWAGYLLRNAALKTADAQLNATYRKITRSLGQTERKKLLDQQRAWIRERNNAAFTRHAKGSPEYLELLADATLKREVALREQYGPGRAETPATAVDLPAQATVPPPVERQEPVMQKKDTFPSERNGLAAPGREPKQNPARDAAAQVDAGKTKDTPPKAGARAISAAPPNPMPEQKIPPQRASGTATPATSSTEDLIVRIAPRKAPPSSNRKSARINTTPAAFGKEYNTLALSFKTASFPLVPTDVTGGGAQRTERYAITDAISILFNYAEQFEKPESIVFRGKGFLTGLPRNRDDIAYALVAVLKTLSHDPGKTDRDKDAEIFGLMRNINSAFTSDSTRIWRNNGLLYVISYIRQSDLFSMTVTPDTTKK